jgi:hypothetical protein
MSSHLKSVAVQECMKPKCTEAAVFIVRDGLALCSKDALEWYEQTHHVHLKGATA